MEKVAVLASGGLDSSILLADIAQTKLSFPIYVRAGLAWEDEEFRALESFVAATKSPNIQPITVLTAPMQRLYGGDHWSVTGDGVPEAEAAGWSVFLPGRNILLLGLAAIWCSTHGVSTIALGTLWGTPFPDTAPEFFQDFARALSLGLAHEISIETPYRRLNKEDIIRRHGTLPLELTLTCMAPRGGVHCGACNKCRERQDAFQRATVPDRTRYAFTREQV
jgi:7-cyano-7-deazaguanine synthase